MVFRLSSPAVRLALATTLVLAVGSMARAGTVKGVVKLPDHARSTRLYQGYWRLEIGDLDARPRLVVVGPGSVIEIKNTGKVKLNLSTPAAPSVMPPELLPAGGTRRAKFDSVG